MESYKCLAPPLEPLDQVEEIEILGDLVSQSAIGFK